MTAFSFQPLRHGDAYMCQWFVSEVIFGSCNGLSLVRGWDITWINVDLYNMYSKTWVSDHLAWATTLPWATVFSCTYAILVHFTLSPTTTWQTRPVAYLELVIYLVNAAMILLQNTKLTVKFTRDGRLYLHLTPHCRTAAGTPTNRSTGSILKGQSP